MPASCAGLRAFQKGWVPLGGVTGQVWGLARGARGAKGSEALWGGSRDKAWHCARVRVFLCDRSGKPAKGIALEIALSVPWLPLLEVERGACTIALHPTPSFPSTPFAEQRGRKHNPNAPVPIRAAALSRGFCKSGRHGSHPPALICLPSSASAVLLCSRPPNARGVGPLARPHCLAACPLYPF